MRCIEFVHAHGHALGLLRAAVVSGLAITVAGCAWSQAEQDYQSNVGAAPAQVAVAVPPKIVIEDDGLPSQFPPRLRPRHEPDDPSEPFSPNYGPAPEGVGPTEPQLVEPPRRAEGLRSGTQRVAMSEVEANAIIARAIAEHERRNP